MNPLLYNKTGMKFPDSVEAVTAATPAAAIAATTDVVTVTCDTNTKTITLPVGVPNKEVILIAAHDCAAAYNLETAAKATIPMNGTLAKGLAVAINTMTRCLYVNDVVGWKVSVTTFHGSGIVGMTYPTPAV